MSNIHKNARGKLCATYNDIEYEFDSIIDLLMSISTIKKMM